MSRIRLLLVAGIVLLAAGWWISRPTTFSIRPTADRNVLIVTIDSLRADALGAYGGRALTPNLDRLAARGARFEFAHAHAVTALPSQASILTGRYPYDHAMRDLATYMLPSGMPTIAMLLQLKGFATGVFLGSNLFDRRSHLFAGFDVRDVSFLPTPGQDRQQRADHVVTAALNWINTQSGKWLSWVDVYDPHTPYTAPAEWADKFPSDPYLAEVSWSDHALGALFDRVDALPRSTLVVVTADHGESLGEHGEATHGLFAYESTLRVPLIVAELGGTTRSAPKGVVLASPVRHVDILPTILDAVEAPAVPELAGVSLRELIAAGPGGDQWGVRGRARDRASYFEAMGPNFDLDWAPLRGVMVGRDKFIDVPVAELYDLKADSQEARNVAASATERREVLLNTLRNFSASPARRPVVAADSGDGLQRAALTVGVLPPLRESYAETEDPKTLITVQRALDAAEALLRAQHAGEAAAAYTSIVTQRPEVVAAYRGLADSLAEDGRLPDAIAALESAVRAGITTRSVKRQLGEWLSKAGQHARAIAVLTSFGDELSDVQIALGAAYQAAGQFSDAVKVYQHLNQIDPESGIGSLNLGLLSLRDNAFDTAGDWFRSALAKNPLLPDALTGLATVLTHAGRSAEAADALAKASRLRDELSTRRRVSR